MMDSNVLISESESLREALERLNQTAKKVLLVVDEQDKLLGTITDGDMRRFIINGKSLDDDIAEVYNRDPIYIRKGEFSIEMVNRKLVQNKIELLPIVDEDDRVIGFKTWDQLFPELPIAPTGEKSLDADVVIMAGGKGTRLDPFTRILPKALIPVGNKPIIEWIIEEFGRHGLNRYYLTVNHKHRMVESYFSGLETDYEITFVREQDFSGTAGSLKLLGDTIGEHFIVSNCDVIVRADFEDVLNFHKDRQADLTILTAIQHHRIPYGVIEFTDRHEVTGILEKPEYTFTINTGVYVLSRRCLDHIPDGRKYDMTELIGTLTGAGRKVAMYVVGEEDYTDIGQWEEYRKSLDKLPAAT